MNFSRQELFNRAWHGVVNQGCASMNEGSGCLYNGPNNTHCAFAHMVPPELRPKLKENKYYAFQLGIPEIAAYFGATSDTDKRLMSMMQAAHDNAHNQNGLGVIEYFKRRMREIAHLFNLTTPEATQGEQA